MSDLISKALGLPKIDFGQLAEQAKAVGLAIVAIGKKTDVIISELERLHERFDKIDAETEAFRSQLAYRIGRDGLSSRNGADAGGSAAVAGFITDDSDGACDRNDDGDTPRQPARPRRHRA